MAATGTPFTSGGQRRLRRPTEGRILGGVATGIARYFQIDVPVVRVGFVVLCLFGGMAIPLYVGCWLFIPAEGTESSFAADLLCPS
jgi:phage shock protein C